MIVNLLRRGQGGKTEEEETKKERDEWEKKEGKKGRGKRREKDQEEKQERRERKSTKGIVDVQHDKYGISSKHLFDGRCKRQKATVQLIGSMDKREGLSAWMAKQEGEM